MESFILKPLSPEQRTQFHRTFLHWLASSENSELEVLEQALALAPNANASRSMVTFIRQSLISPQMCSKLPKSRVQLLRDRNWPQAESGVVTTVVAA